MPTRHIASIVFGFLMLVGVVPVTAQVVIPNQQHQTLTVELHSVRDEVTMYVGDPQDFLRLYANPRSVPPRVDFTNPAQAAVLRIRDQTLFEGPPPLEEEFIDGEEYYEESEQRIPDAQSWDVRLSPASPATYVLQCDEGKGSFDFTDLAVQEVYLFGDSSEVRVEFSRPNLVELERFKLIAEGGSVEFFGMLNARAKSMTITAPRAECTIEITGKPFDGEAELFFEGVPRSIRFLVSRKIGLRLDGPASTIARFDDKRMRRDGLSLVTRDYDQKKCRLRMHFAESIPTIDVEWD